MGSRTPQRRDRSSEHHLTFVAALALAALALLTPAAVSAGAGPAHEVTIVGVIGALPAGPGLVGDWTVTSVIVHVAATTAIDESKGAAAIGALVQVKGVPRPDRSIDASAIRVLATMPQPRLSRPVELTGVVAALPASPDLVGDWQVGAAVVHVSAATHIDQRLAPATVGALVHVRGTARSDGSVDALEIDVKRSAQPARDCSFALLHLAPTDAAPTAAEGVVITRYLLFGDGSVREDLQVAVEKLAAQSAYDVVVDGIAAGLIVTSDEGEGHLFLSTADVPGAEPLPAELRPLADRVHIEVLAAGTAVLVGDFEDAAVKTCGHAEADYLAMALLQNASGDPLAVAVASIRRGVQTLRLAAWGLSPGATYALLVDGTALGNLLARGDGTLDAVYSNGPGAGQRPLPPQALPVSNLLHAELHAADGSPVAAGDFALPPGG